jgi:hypothetical protein
MSKYITGFLIGVILTLVVVSIIYPNIQADINSGNFWNDVSVVFQDWFNMVKEWLHNAQA